MVTCGAINCGNSSSKKKSSDVKGWHKILTLGNLERMKWLHAMRRDPPHPSDENFYICGLHFEDDCFEPDLKVVLLLNQRCS